MQTMVSMMITVLALLGLGAVIVADCCTTVVTIAMTNTTTLVTPKTTIYEYSNISTSDVAGISQTSATSNATQSNHVSLSPQANLTSAAFTSPNGTIVMSTTRTTTITISINTTGTVSNMFVSAHNDTTGTGASVVTDKKTDSSQSISTKLGTALFTNMTTSLSEYSNTALYQMSSNVTTVPTNRFAPGSTITISFTTKVTETIPPTMTCTIGHICPENGSLSSSFVVSTSATLISPSNVASHNSASSSTKSYGVLANNTSSVLPPNTSGLGNKSVTYPGGSSTSTSTFSVTSNTSSSFTMPPVVTPTENFAMSTTRVPALATTNVGGKGVGEMGEVPVMLLVVLPAVLLL